MMLPGSFAGLAIAQMSPMSGSQQQGFAAGFQIPDHGLADQIRQILDSPNCRAARPSKRKFSGKKRPPRQRHATFKAARYIPNPTDRHTLQAPGPCPRSEVVPDANIIQASDVT